MPFSLARLLSTFLLPAWLVLVASAAADQAPSAQASAKKPGADKVNSGGFSFLVEPPPSWITSLTEGTAPVPAGSGMHYGLTDHQVKIEHDRSIDYWHVIRVVDEAGGLGTAAQIQAWFDPSYQTLVMHKLEIVRAGTRINKLDPKKIELLHRETQLDYRMYDGLVTASIVLDDVRVGDRIEYSYSIRGSNPVFGDKFVTSAWVKQQIGPASLYRMRILAPESREIHYMAGPEMQVTSSITAGQREILFTQTSVPQLIIDPLAPETIYLADQIQISEFDDWASVAHWGTSLFEISGTISEELRQRANSIRAATTTPEERLRAALEFVQNDVRYFGMEMGESSHHPTAPGKVLEQRFGDCKDKVTLLIALLRQLSIDATPVLVSTHYRDELAGMLPSPLAFNHVIARVVIADHVYFLDATRSGQTGPFEQRASVGLGRGLELTPTSTALSELPSAENEERVAVEDVITVSDFTKDPTLEARVTLSGELAEGLRLSVASQPLEQLETRLITSYGRFYPRIHAEDHLKVVEEPNRNAVTMVQHFTLPGFWKFPEEKALYADIGFWNISATLQLPEDPRRSRPWRFAYPGTYRERAIVNFPEDVYTTPASQTFDDPGSHFDYHVVYTNKTRSAELSAILHFPDTSVSPEDWQAFSERVVTLRRSRFGGRVSYPPASVAVASGYDKQYNDRLTAIRAGTWTQKVVTAAEATSAAREIALTAWLAGNRLEPELRAQVLRDLGSERDNLGWSAMARENYAEAIRLSPADPKNYAGAAMNAFDRGEDAPAIEWAQKALTLSPSDPTPRNVLAYASYFSHDFAKTKGQMKLVARTTSGKDQAYPVIWIYLAAKGAGEDGAAAVQPYVRSDATMWPYPVLSYLMGKTDLDATQKAAMRDMKDPSHLCELYFYAGEKYLLDGDTVRARGYFKMSVDTGATELKEYVMARRSLAALPAS